MQKLLKSEKKSKCRKVESMRKRKEVPERERERGKERGKRKISKQI